MYAYGTAGRPRYSEIVLLYPATKSLVNRAFDQDELALRVRQFNLKSIYDPEALRLGHILEARGLHVVDENEQYVRPRICRLAKAIMLIARPRTSRLLRATVLIADDKSQAHQD
jgi:hypothetical protein